MTKEGRSVDDAVAAGDGALDSALGAVTSLPGQLGGWAGGLFGGGGEGGAPEDFSPSDGLKPAASPAEQAAYDDAKSAALARSPSARSSASRSSASRSSGFGASSSDDPEARNKSRRPRARRLPPSKRFRPRVIRRGTGGAREETRRGGGRAPAPS